MSYSGPGNICFWYLKIMLSIRQIFILAVGLLFCLPAHAQETSDGRYLPDGAWQPRNPNATIDISTDNVGDWPVVTEWGDERYVTDTIGGDYVNPRIVVSDSVLHVFSKGFLDPHHYVSYDNGNNWIFFANYVDTTFNIDPRSLSGYFI